jgi:hypothetical protein
MRVTIILRKSTNMNNSEKFVANERTRGQRTRGQVFILDRFGAFR